MGHAESFTPEKLFIGILFHDTAIKETVLQLLQDRFGLIDCCSDTRNFSSFSSYYDQEMGSPVYRVFISFATLVDPGELANIKTWTNACEVELAGSLGRQVNIDPGLISAGRVALATTKNAGHRLALGQGIYGEITLFYAKKDYHALPWTYPDFQDFFVREALLAMRRIYMKKLKNES